MKQKRPSARGLRPGDPVIVEVEGYEGQDGEIVVENWRADQPGFGVSHVIYCIAALGDDGVVRFNDWGYATADEARGALQARLRVTERA